MRKSHDVNHSSFSPDITDEKRKKLIEKFEKDVEARETLKREGVHEHTIKKTLGFSRSTYFRRKRALSALIRGAEVPSRRPKRLRAVSWGEPQLELILQIRRENPVTTQLTENFAYKIRGL
ncbi:MAG: hypothetical protein LBJ96_01395 [Holosporaceae bacterium]|jgi:hypothetical protein|nr:hypothetical protein [Holosporaceae bacterium]